MKQNQKIVVLVGGPSSEAEVSRRTGAGIADALTERGHHVQLMEFVPATVLADLQAAEADVVFNAIHGKYGEDGALAGLLEIIQMPYTGSGVTASALAMNKKLSKDVFRANGIPTARASTYDARHQTVEEMIDSITQEHTFPVVVKAATQGSSIGVVTVMEKSALPAAMEEVLRYDTDVVVEDFLSGGEFTVAVLDGVSMPVIQICPKSGEYDYESKYTVGATEYLVPAPIEEGLSRTMRNIAERVYQVFHCCGVARVDFMTDAQGVPHVLEVNTVPGMTATSLVPKAAAAMGVSYADVCERVLATASVGKA